MMVTIAVIDRNFWMQRDAPKDGSDNVIPYPSDTEHDGQIDSASGPHTNLSISDLYDFNQERVSY
jgi:hypothetical protein